jgi:hypothetical protein
MVNKTVARIATIGMLVGTFTLGYVCGSVSTPRANAQLPQIPGGLGGQSGGGLGAVVELGSSIKDMEKNVSGLQKNLDTFKKIQSALGGK